MDLLSSPSSAEKPKATITSNRNNIRGVQLDWSERPSCPSEAMGDTMDISNTADNMGLPLSPSVAKKKMATTPSYPNSSFGSLFVDTDIAVHGEEKDHEININGCIGATLKDISNQLNMFLVL
jgi:hypothetical protein